MYVVRMSMDGACGKNLRVASRRGEQRPGSRQQEGGGGGERERGRGESGGGGDGAHGFLGEERFWLKGAVN